MLKEIKEVFGKNSIICFGDWSMKCGHKGNMSSPNIRLKRLLSTQMRVYNLDEFRTSSPFWGFQSLIGSCFYKNNLFINKYFNIFI